MDRKRLTRGERSAGRTERLAAALVARHDFAATVRLLNTAGILPMPLKGVLLQHLVYQDPADRLLSDADLLVPPGRFRDAVATLRKAGFRVDPEGRAGSATKGPDARLEVDVHRRPFAPRLFGLDGEGMFARGRIDETAFDAVVVIPDPRDLYAHLVGNFAKGRHGAESVAQLRDFSAVGSRFSLAEVPVARHLERFGLARAARYALPFADDPFSRKVLHALRGDPVGVASAALARSITGRFGSRAHRSLIAPHLVNRSITQGVASATLHVAIGVRNRLQRKLR